MKDLLRERGMILLLGFLLDLMIGDPEWLYHPVQAMGALISALERLLWSRFCFREGETEPAKLAGQRLAGAALVFFTASVSTALPAGVLNLLKKQAGEFPFLYTVYFVLSVFWCSQMLAVRSLDMAGKRVYRALTQGTLPDARRAVGRIVGRDTERLDAAGVTRAAVESIAESTSDGVIAPLFWMLLFGVPGGFFYKSVNTMDSMIGYRNARYQAFGTAAARLDDLLNFLPARLGGLLMVLGAYLTDVSSGRRAARVFFRDRHKSPSPNAAHTEAACAGALGVQLGGKAWYGGRAVEKKTLGDPDREIESADILRAGQLMRRTSILGLLTGILLLLLFAFVV